MTPIEFDESDVVLAESQPEYQSLPIAIEGNERISCWKLTLKDKVSLLFLGRLWLRQLTFGNPFQPVLLQVKNPFDD